EALRRLVEAHDVEQARMDVDLQARHVVEAYPVLRDQRQRCIERAQIAAAAGIALDRESGVDDGPVGAELLAHTAEIVVALAVEGREEAVVALEPVRIGEV